MKELIVLAIAAILVAWACAQVDFGTSNLKDGGWNYSPREIWSTK